MDLYILVYLLSNIFLAHIINKFMYLFYEKCRVNKYIEFCIYSLYFVLITLVFLNFGNPVITVSFNILCIFLFTLTYDCINLNKSIAVAFIIYLILFSVEASVVILINFNRFYDVNLDNYRNMISLIINSVIYVVVYNFMYIKKINFRKMDIIFLNRYCSFFIFFPFISICLIIIGSIFLNNIYLIIILNLVLLFLNIFTFKYCNFIYGMYKSFLDKFLNDKLKNYKREVEIFGDGIDFKKYINSNNYVINSMLNFKINNIYEEVKLTFDVSIEENLRINLNDLIIIIGNLMDNAISGVKSTLKNEEKYINVKIKYVKGTIILNIKNSFNETKLMKKGAKIFNKKRKFHNYGLGLLSVKEIVDKYKGVLEIKFSKSNFETYVLLYDVKV